MRILMTRRYPERVIAAAQALFEVEIREETAPLKPGQMRGALALYDGIVPTVGDAFSADVFDEYEAPRCKVLANFGEEVRHIDGAAARRVGISVTNTPDLMTDVTADLAVTLMLMSARRVGEGERMVRAGAWHGSTPTQLLGLHVSGKTVGIIGMGRIGQAIARRCHLGFDMHVLYFNRSAKTLAVPAERCETLGELAERADIVVIALPDSAQTHHAIKAPFFHAMQRHAHVISISRGEVVDLAALNAALTRGEIAGAGLDLGGQRPDVPEGLRAMEQVTLLPDLGSATLEVREQIGLMAVENLRAVLNGDEPLNPVN